MKIKLIKPSVKILKIGLKDFDEVQEGEVEKFLELCGRVSYKSEDKITPTSYEKFIRLITNLGHESLLEHASLTIQFIISRISSHQLVRHRHISPTQQSQRYAKEECLSFIIPEWCDMEEQELYFTPTYKEYVPEYWKCSQDTKQWLHALCTSAQIYENLINEGRKQEEAREILPGSTKTEINLTTNFRELKHIFKLRCDSHASPEMQKIMNKLLLICKNKWPLLFNDISTLSSFDDKKVIE